MNRTAPSEIYTLSLHDALPISQWRKTESANGVHLEGVASDNRRWTPLADRKSGSARNAETELVCRLLLEKKTATGSAGIPRIALAPSVRVALCAPCTNPGGARC